MSRERILSLLLEQQGTFLSGEEMSRTLGISRAAVWKAIESLRQEGYEVTSIPKRGYCLKGGLDRLRAGELAPALKHCEIGSSLLCLEEVDSTNTEAKRQALAGAPHGLVVLSEAQSGGRGRLGRDFQSAKGKGLYLSALLRPRQRPEEVVDFTAWTAVAVCEGIEACCGVSPSIKWTNDLVFNGKKLCGILTELGLEGETRSLDYLIVGIGTNVNYEIQEFAPELREVATSLTQICGREIRRTDLAVAIICAMDQMYRSFPSGKEEYLEKYRKKCVTTGQQVQIITPAQRKEAYALEIDDEFRLVVQYADGTKQALAAGEVSVRGMYGYV